MTAPCAGKWDLFDSTDPVDHIEAANYCRTCPIIAACRDALATTQTDQHSRYGAQGTWAGRLYVDGRPTSPRIIRMAAAAADDTGRAYQIATTVAPHFDTTANHILSTSRRVNVSSGRHVVCWVMYEMGLPLTAIGTHLGRDHTTVLSSVRRVNTSPDLLDLATSVLADQRQEVAA